MWRTGGRARRMPAYSIWSFGALLLVERAAFVHTRGTVPRGVAGSGRIGGRRDSRPWQEQDYTGTASARWDGGRLPAGIAAAAVDFAGVFLRAATYPAWNGLAACHTGCPNGTERCTASPRERPETGCPVRTWPRRLHPASDTFLVTHAT